MNITTTAAKIIGIAGLGLTASNIIIDGNINARKETNNELGESYTDIYKKNLSLSRDCNLLQKIKNNITNHRIDSNFYPFIIGVKNHITSYIGEVFENITPIALSLTAIFAPGLLEKHVPKAGKLGTIIVGISSGFLIFGAAKLFLHDVWGIGKDEK